MLSFFVLLGVLAVLMAARMPIAFAMGLAGTAGLWVQLGPAPALSVLERVYYDSAASFVLVAIPLFILMAELLTQGDVTRRAVLACQAWTGHVRGGLALATVWSSVLLAALVGSSTASTAAMASSAFPEMRRHKYDDRLSAAVVTVGGTLAVMVPPSIVLVIYGVLTETSIGKLFIAGVAPGLLTAAGLAVAVRWVARKPGAAPAGDAFALGPALRQSRHILPMALLIAAVIGAIYGGIASPSEAAALGVTGALVIGLAQRTLRPAGIATSFSGAIRATVMIVAIIACSAIFANYLAFTRVTQSLLEAVSTTAAPPAAILLAMVAILLVMGMLMDQLAILSLAMPLAFPAAMQLGYDPVWFGIVVTKTVEIGLLTPPLGLNAYVASAQTKVPLKVIFSGLGPFLVAEIVVLALLIAFPQITLFLPGLMR